MPSRSSWRHCNVLSTKAQYWVKMPRLADDGIMRLGDHENNDDDIHDSTNFKWKHHCARKPIWQHICTKWDSLTVWTTFELPIKTNYPKPIMTKVTDWAFRLLSDLKVWDFFSNKQPLTALYAMVCFTDICYPIPSGHKWPIVSNDLVFISSWQLPPSN